MPPLSQALQLRDVAQALGISLPEGHSQAPSQSLEDLVGGDERAGVKREVRLV